MREISSRLTGYGHETVHHHATPMDICESLDKQKEGAHREPEGNGPQVRKLCWLSLECELTTTSPILAYTLSQGSENHGFNSCCLKRSDRDTQMAPEGQMYSLQLIRFQMVPSMFVNF
ncbi:hypothetical protein WA026_007353 [Henosepilachna vigintioctopunctata]|uniref:Uncharacterized protein n=1 Tax=Henosepilachna vigintioctopunctata TaxID=420089 RepID=A0AAW1UVL8_9CUCU